MIWTCSRKTNNDKIVKKIYQVRVEGNRGPKKNRWRLLRKMCGIDELCG